MSGEPWRSLLVADVDLDAKTCVVLPSATPLEQPPQGIHAVVWLHGEPIGELTASGPPEHVLPGLVAAAEAALRRERVEHLLSDALASPGGLLAAERSGLAGVPHPPPASAGLPSISVAVCTRDRPEALRSCLQALACLIDPVLEVLVVDNAGRDDRTRVVAAEFPFVRYVREPRQGLDWARDRAAMEATGDVVAYTDDDVLVHPSWAGALARAFAEEPGAACVTGLVTPAELSTSAQVLFEVMGGFGRGYRRQWFSARVGHEAAGDVCGSTGRAGTGANMAFRRQILLDLGGFDPALDVGTPAGGGGDLEMLFRVVAAGHLLTYEPAAVVRHVHRPDPAQLHRQVRGNGTGAYTYFLGAGANYDRSERAALRRWAVRFAVDGHVRGLLRSLVAPELLPPSLRVAETSGAVSAVLGRYYARAVRQAAREARRHPGQQSLVTRWPRAAATAEPPDSVVSVDLLAAHAADEGSGAPPGPASARTWVRVLRAGRVQDVVSVATRGSALSCRRLRHELVQSLGPALLRPGWGWPDPATDRPAGPAAGAGAVRWDDETTLERLLHGGPAQRESPQPTTERITVLVTTGCTESLRVDQVLAALAEQRVRPRPEIVVVDRSAGAGAVATAVRANGARLVPARGLGLAAARNLGLREATGGLVALLDDDAVPQPDWLEQLLSPFADPTVWMVTGKVLPDDVEAPSAQLLLQARAGEGPHRRTYTRGWLHQDVHPAPVTEIGTTANAALRRRVVDEVGPWLETVAGDGDLRGAEEWEFFYRLLDEGGCIAYEPTALVLTGGGADVTAVRTALRQEQAGRAAHHLLAAGRYADWRGLRTVVPTTPRQLLRRTWRAYVGAGAGCSDVPLPRSSRRRARLAAVRSAALPAALAAASRRRRPGS